MCGDRRGLAGVGRGCQVTGGEWKCHVILRPQDGREDEEGWKLSVVELPSMEELGDYDEAQGWFQDERGVGNGDGGVVALEMEGVAEVSNQWRG